MGVVVVILVHWYKEVSATESLCESGLERDALFKFASKNAGYVVDTRKIVIAILRVLEEKERWDAFCLGTPTILSFVRILLFSGLNSAHRLAVEA